MGNLGKLPFHGDICSPTNVTTVMSMLTYWCHELRLASAAIFIKMRVLHKSKATIDKGRRREAKDRQYDGYDFGIYIHRKTSREYTNYLLSAEDRYRGRGYDRGQEAEQKQFEIMEDRRDKVQTEYHVLELQPEAPLSESVSALFHATYCKEELETFKLRSSKTLKDVRYISGLKRRLILVGQLDEEGYHIGFEDHQWKVTKSSLVVAHENKCGSMYMVKVHPEGIGAIINAKWFGEAEEAFLHNVREDKETSKIRAIGVAVGGSSDTSKESKNSGIFEDSRRSDEEYSEDKVSSKEGGSDTLQVRRSTRKSRAPVRYSPSANYLLLTENGEPESYSEALRLKNSRMASKRYKARLLVKGFKQKQGEPSYVGALNDTSTQQKSEGFQLARQEENLECILKEILYGLIQAPRLRYLKFDSFMQKDKNEEPCRDVHQVGDEREVEVLHNFNWTPSELITEDVHRVPYVQLYRKVRAVALFTRRLFPVFGWCSVFRSGLIPWTAMTILAMDNTLYLMSIYIPQLLSVFAFFVAKRIEFIKSRHGYILPYGILLTRLLRYVMVEYPRLQRDQYGL
ncbi:retrovirus-related pol polyprotein from transposon TNT 1-94 [Tanacetum coccineum]